MGLHKLDEALKLRDDDRSSLLLSVSIQTWGAGGFNGDDPGAESTVVNFEINVPDTGTISEDIGAYYLTNTNTGEPTFGWIPAENATWTLLYLGTNDDGVYAARFIRWFKVEDMLCPNGVTEICFVTPESIFLTNGTYEWWMISWDPAGFGTGGAYNGWVKSPLDVVVQAPTPPLAVPLTPTNLTYKTDYITFLWDHVETVSWYQIWVGSAPEVVNTQEDWSNVQTYYLEWLHARDICHSGVCSITSQDFYLPNDGYRWYLQTYNPAWTPSSGWNTEQFGSFSVNRLNP